MIFRKTKNNNVNLLIILLLSLYLLVSGCGGGARTEAPSASPAPASAPQSAALKTEGASTPRAADTRKVIETASVILETKDLPATETKVLQLLSQKQGKADIANVSMDSAGRKQGSYVLRVPQSQLTNFVNELAALSDTVIRQRNVSSQDVTEEYIDINARLENMNRQELRLREILSRANTVDEILKVEKELTNVRTQIESTTAKLKSLTGRIEMSTLQLKINEVSVVTETQYGGKFSQMIRDSIVTAGDVFLGMIAFVIISSPIVIAILIIIMFIRKRRAKKFAQQQETQKGQPNL